MLQRRPFLTLSLFATTVMGCVVAASGRAQATSPRLIPVPQQMHLLGSSPIGSVQVLVDGNSADDAFAADQLRSYVRDHGLIHDGKAVFSVHLTRTDSAQGRRWVQAEHLTETPSMKEEGYSLVVKKEEAVILANSGSGIFYGVQTLKQLIEGRGKDAHVWLGTIQDWPAMRYRGVSDDLSRGPIPTLDFQKHQLEVFAAYKMNVYSPYFENTLRYDKDPLAAVPGGAMTPSEVRELVQYADKLHITIIPEQEAFGHLHHFLEYDKYADLAESLHGNVLAPLQPGVIEQVSDWFTQIAAEFPGPFIHIGADETFDLGTGRTKDKVKQFGLPSVYADFLLQIHEKLKPLSRKLLFWGDIAWNSEDAVKRIPKDMIAVPWVYWHEDNYDKNILPFKTAGIETWVATGDANWSMMYPLGENAMDNIRGFTESGQRLGSTGELVTVWNDDGEGLFNQDWFGVIFGAAAAWQPAKIPSEPFQSAFGLQFYQDPSGRIDEAQKELILAQKEIDTSDAMFWMDPWTKEGQAKLEKIRPKLVTTRKHAERAIELLQEVKASEKGLTELDALNAMELGARRIDFMAEKFELSDEMSDAYRKAYSLRGDKEHSTEVRELLASIAGMNGRCDDLRNGYSLLRSLYQASWLAENRPFWVDNVLVRYDVERERWQKRSSAIQAIRETWEKDGSMPAPGPLGVPMAEVSATELQ